MPDLDSDASDVGLAEMPAAQDPGHSRYALCTWTNGEDPEFVPIDVRNEDLTLRILCALVQEGYADDLAKAYERVQEPILRYLQSIKRSEYPKDFLLETFEKDVQNSTHK